ncbi:hypothetical protein [Acetoanaerobium noterae]
MDKENKPIVADKEKTITASDYQALIKKMARLEEENEILKKAMGIFTRK